MGGPGASGEVRVLVVEDHPVLRGVIRLACEQTPGLALAGEVGTGEEAVEACRALHPDVVVLDLNLPGALQGLDAVHRRCAATGGGAVAMSLGVFWMTRIVRVDV